MAKTININFSGGFHGHDDVIVRARLQDKGSYLGAYISAGQAKRLDREFCGMADCMCGGVARADMEVPAGWEATTEGLYVDGLLAYREAIL
jgi:hypothetical protein